MNATCEYWKWHWTTTAQRKRTCKRPVTHGEVAQRYVDGQFAGTFVMPYCAMHGRRVAARVVDKDGNRASDVVLDVHIAGLRAALDAIRNA